MKRGLVVLDPAEVPVEEWGERVGGLQRRLAAEGVDLALVYGDVFSSDDIAYLTNLCIYWNEGVLAVPAEGEPVFLTKLSPRVHPWMRRVSTVSRIESGRQFGALAAKLAEGREAGTVGLVDAPLWPAPVVAELRAALPGWRFAELPGLVREQRAVPSAAELVLLEEAARVVGGAADEAVAGGLGGHERVATVERLVRGAGFLDVQVNTADAADGAQCVQVTGQYRTLWVHAARLAGGAGADWAAALQDALDRAVAAALPGATGADLGAAARPALERLPQGTDARARWTDQTDLASAGEYRPATDGTPLTAGSVVAVTVDALLPGGGYAALADTVLITPDGARRLTAAGAAANGGIEEHTTSTNGAGRPGGRSAQ
ncbi:hypothetical protein GCM10018793_65810 [Streptomyces sulfonofaciens]|uniref:Creatinase N-terminal domain-containing protein n=1 Tax=Streptomyces sulfonofaciens TaxID=68272 RepID=A0A919GNA2_9ACTN|nr:aminopeptidase P family N-terminal domain-containing protein [Streptomyces sulfonofaciens]GHH87965.1 hypothetical protein GCM10018793_65810 [Streptomyces sulfonofaciens]